jgi:hypothetical protein
MNTELGIYMHFRILAALGQWSHNLGALASMQALIKPRRDS